MIGTRTSSSYTPHVDVAPADRPLILVAPRWEEAEPFLTEMLSPNEEIASVFVAVSYTHLTLPTNSRV